MAKRSLGSSVRGKQTKGNARSIQDRKIDYSDIPELSDAQLKNMKRVGRPLLGSAKRKLIAVRVDPVVLNQLKLEAKGVGKGYQTLINEVLSRHVRRRAA